MIVYISNKQHAATSWYNYEGEGQNSVRDVDELSRRPI